VSYLELNRWRGLGEAADETPEVKILPWNIGKEEAPTPREVRTEKWESAGLYLGVLGALTGLLLAIPELVRMAERRKKRRR
jgi:hypothetical protein